MPLNSASTCACHAGSGLGAAYSGSSMDRLMKSRRRAAKMANSEFMRFLFHVGLVFRHSPEANDSAKRGGRKWGLETLSNTLLPLHPATAIVQADDVGRVLKRVPRGSIRRKAAVDDIHVAD